MFFYTLSLKKIIEISPGSVEDGFDSLRVNA